MSQAKVDRYKEEKKNRAKNLKKKKVKKVVSIFIGACLVGAAVGYPLGKHIYKVSEEKRAAKATISADSFDNWSREYWNDEYTGSTGLTLGDVVASDSDAIASDDDAEEIIVTPEDDASDSDASSTDASASDATASDAE